jgi:Kelch motif protein
MLSALLLALVAAATPTPAQKLGLPPVKAGPVPGYVMIADRNNNRIILVSPAKKLVWTIGGLHDPDDAFFGPGYTSISTNEEYNQTMALIGVRSHRIEWSYGHPGVRGSAPGYLSNPDDAYLLPNGLMQVADIQNCRVLWVNRAKRIVRSIGHAGNCTHDPPRSLSSPNGATPLPDGGVLVTEIGGWIDRLDPQGKLVYTVHTPTSYPSDAQLLANGNLLVAGFNTPGRVDEITPRGKIVWSYRPTGQWSLDRPSLAVRWPNGMIAITDDWHHRVVVVDPRTKKVVWSYGHLNSPGSAPGYLNKPDGLDLLPGVPGGTKAARKTITTVVRIGSLPQALSKASAVALPGGRLMVLGGEVGGASTDRVLVGTPRHLRVVGHLPAPTHDAAAAELDGSVLLFGGGQAVSTDAIVRVDSGGHARAAGKLDEPLSDLGAAVVGGKVYLVGGYTGSTYASAVLRYDGGGRTSTVARLPAGTRYAGVASLGGRVVVAGGITPAGMSSAVYAVDPGSGSVKRIATLPAAMAHAGMAALGNAVYLVGGRDVLRIAGGAVTVVARLPVALADPAVVAVGGVLVIVGGGTSGVYAFTPR